MKFKLLNLTLLSILSVTQLLAQNKREQIEILTFEKDSLITLINIETVKNNLTIEKKDEKITSLENENNRLNKEVFSLKGKLEDNKVKYKTIIDSLNSDITRLNSQIEDFKSANVTDTLEAAPAVTFNPILIWGNNQKRLDEYPDDGYEVKVTQVDIDKDGTNELLLEYFTGGAHCCFIYRVFKKVQEDTYKMIYYHNGGENSFSIKNKTLYAYFYEKLGYFHSSYASRMDDKLPYKYNLAYYRKVYDKGVFRLAETDEALNGKIIKNLEFLKTIPPQTYQSKSLDDGIRKSYAEHIIAYYYNNNENIVLTKKVFDKYYLASDANAIFKEIVAQINDISK